MEDAVYSYLLEVEAYSIPIWPNYITTYCNFYCAWQRPYYRPGANHVSVRTWLKKYQIPYLVVVAGI